MISAEDLCASEEDWRNQFDPYHVSYHKGIPTEVRLDGGRNLPADLEGHPDWRLLPLQVPKTREEEGAVERVGEVIEIREMIGSLKKGIVMGIAGTVKTVMHARRQPQRQNNCCNLEVAMEQKKQSLAYIDNIGKRLQEKIQMYHSRYETQQQQQDGSLIATILLEDSLCHPSSIQILSLLTEVLNSIKDLCEQENVNSKESYSDFMFQLNVQGRRLFRLQGDLMKLVKCLKLKDDTTKTENSKQQPHNETPTTAPL